MSFFMPVVVCLALAMISGSAPAADWEKTELGETAIFKMQSAPYPHESRKDGFKTATTTFPCDPHYVDNSVALFIPKGYQSQEQIDLLVYFHGHFNNITKSMEHYKLREQIVASGKNMILVFPEGPKDAGDSGCGKLEEPNGLKRLVTEALDTLAAEGKIKSKRPGRVLLAGHSGAYRALSFCIQDGGMPDNVTDTCLLDASYAQLDPFIDWLAVHDRARLFSIFTDHLAADNVYMMTHLRKRKIAYELLNDEDATDAIVAGTRALFLHTSRYNHDQTVQWLERWLRATSLTPR